MEAPTLAYPSAIGIHVPFYAPTTLGFWQRLAAHTQQVRDTLFLPISGIPTTLAQNRPREASPTGKSGMGVATYSVSPQPLGEARTMLYDTNPIYKGEARLVTQAVVSPFSQNQSRGLLGPKFT